MLTRTSFSALAMVALLGLVSHAFAGAQQGARHPHQSGCKGGQNVCGECVKSPQGESGGTCSIECSTAEMTVTVYADKCETVCLLGPPSCGLGGILTGRCLDKRCGRCSPGGAAAKGAGGAAQKGAAGGGASECCGRDGGCDLCRVCRSRGKRRLLKKEVTIECPITTCAVVKGAAKGTKGTKGVAPTPAQPEQVEPLDAEPANDGPGEPPEVNIGYRHGSSVIQTSHTSAAPATPLGSFFK